ncbi:hypothetical protein OCU04_000151 [Sclerotinia nivalis]|uniref:2EXR domain-containing protein n=1 Tax=Sclerotinia nivalis TaxID=352851 RepID=A0A9X0AVI0_9HELO|nr:hypothetical protein OCU04_000151 [Sclerotinia nivalis]
MIDTNRTSRMADFNFPGIDLSDPFLPPPGSISIYSPFEHSTPKLAVKPPHDYGTFTYPLTPGDEQPRPISLPLRSRNFSLNSAPSLSFSRSSSTSSKTSFSSSTFDISSNRLSDTQWEPLTSFPYFTSLPLEIQRTIWRHTLPGPQIMEIYQYASSTPRSSSSIPITEQQDQEPLPILKVHTPFPIALHINHLSRRLALSHLTPLSFAQPYYLPSNPYAYINYLHDTIYLTSRTLYPDLGNHILYSRNLHKIRYLALEFRVWSELLGDNHFVNALLEMEGLLRIDIIFERDLSSLSSHSAFPNNDEVTSSIISKPHEGSIWNRGKSHQCQNTLEFLEPTGEEERKLEDIFERESEKIWLWGRVRGWEDVRGKLRYKWNEEEKNRKTKNATQNRISNLNSLKKNESEFFTHPYSEPRYSGYRSQDAQSEDWEISQRQAGLEEGLESLIHSVDDMILDYEDGARGGAWCVDGSFGQGLDVDADVDVYGESEYSRCSEGLDEDFDDDDDDDDGPGGWI